MFLRPDERVWHSTAAVAMFQDHVCAEPEDPVLEIAQQEAADRVGEDQLLWTGEVCTGLLQLLRILLCSGEEQAR